MNGLYKDPLEESYDDFDDEDVASTTEFNPFGAIKGISSTIGGLLGGGGRRQPVRHDRDRRGSTAPGVRDARLEVPGRGAANLKLPEEVVSKRAFDEATEELQDGIAKITARVNSLEQKDLPELKKEVGALLANTRQALAEEKKARWKAMSRQNRALKSMQTTNLMMSLLFQRQLQSKLESHTHPGNNAVPAGSESTAAPLSSGDSSTLLFLPLMMMGGNSMGGGGGEKEGENDSDYRESSGGDNNMMMMLLMSGMLGK